MFRKVLMATLAILWFAGCTQQPKPIEKVHESINIEGTRWQLMSFGNHATTVPQKAWIRLSGNRYEGNAGCNGLGGTYTISGNTIRFTMDPHTMLACPDIKGENEFRKRLLEADSYAIEAGMLVLKREGKKILVFMKLES